MSSKGVINLRIDRTATGELLTVWFQAANAVTASWVLLLCALLTQL
jgi:hypothetical protein